jgi:hypothetical protein
MTQDVAAMFNELKAPADKHASLRFMCLTLCARKYSVYFSTKL